MRPTWIQPEDLVGLEPRPDARDASPVAERRPAVGALGGVAAAWREDISVVGRVDLEAPGRAIAAVAERVNVADRERCDVRRDGGDASANAERVRVADLERRRAHERAFGGLV